MKGLREIAEYLRENVEPDTRLEVLSWGVKEALNDAGIEWEPDWDVEDLLSELELFFENEEA